MSSGSLLREHAPITERAWGEIDAEAKRTLRCYLAARRMIDFKGPLGWETSAVNLGQVELQKKAPQGGVQARIRKSLPLVELRTPFELPRSVVDDIERGDDGADLDAVVDAAKAAALAEDSAVFNGYGAADIVGILGGSPHKTLKISDKYEQYPALVEQATMVLRQAGVGGPYAIGLGTRCYEGLMQTIHDGRAVYRDVERLLDGPVVWAPAVDGAVILSTRGEDFELTAGRDLSVGYLDHDATTVQLYIEESITFRALSPEAAIRLTYSK